MGPTPQESQLVISDEVRAELGPLQLSAVQRDANDFRCPVCRVNGHTSSEVTSVIVTLHAGGARRVTFGHSKCIGSQVLHSNEPLDIPDIAEEDDVLAMAGFTSAQGKTRPWLYVQRELGRTFLTHGGEQIDPWVSALLSDGWQVPGGLADRMRPAGHGWRLELDEHDEGRLTNQAGAVLLDRLPPLPQGWAAAARRTKTVQVLAGDLGLRPDSTSSLRRENIAQACAAGRAAGAELKVTRRPTGWRAPTPKQRVSQEIADHLRAALRTRANRAGSDRFNSAQLVVETHTVPQLHPILLSQGPGNPEFAALVVDLVDHDLARARATLDAFEQAGMRRDRDLGRSPFPLPPSHWSHVTWPSQILVLAGRNDEDGQLRKVLFEPCVFPAEWLETVGTSPLGNVGLIITNMLNDPIEPDALSTKSQAGELLVVALPGMLTGNPE